MKKIVLFLALVFYMVVGFAQTSTTYTKSVRYAGADADSTQFATQNLWWYGPNGYRFSEDGVKYSLKSYISAFSPAAVNTGWNLSGRTKLIGSAYVYPLNSANEIFIGSNFNQDSLASSVRILSSSLTQVGGATSFVTVDGSGVDAVTNGSDPIQIRSGGSTVIQTATVERLEIENDGAWQVSGVTGTSGQVLTSNGSGSSPTWQTPVLKTVTVSIDNATFLTLDTSPVTLVAAQGVGTFVNILSAHLELSGHPSPTAFNISDNLLIRTNTNEGIDNGIFEMDDGTINQSGLTSPRTYRLMPMDGGIVLQGSTPLNLPMLLGVKNGGSISIGNQTVRIRLVYTVETY